MRAQCFPYTKAYTCSCRHGANEVHDARRPRRVPLQTCGWTAAPTQCGWRAALSRQDFPFCCTSERCTEWWWVIMCTTVQGLHAALRSRVVVDLSTHANQPRGCGARCQASRCACATKPTPYSTSTAFIDPPDAHPLCTGTPLTSCTTMTRHARTTACPARAATHHHVSTSHAPMLRMYSNMHHHVNCRLKLKLRKARSRW